MELSEVKVFYFLYLQKKYNIRQPDNPTTIDTTPPPYL